MTTIREFMELYGIDSPEINEEFRNTVIAIVEKLQTYEYRISLAKSEQFIDNFFDELFPRRVEHREAFYPWKCSQDHSNRYYLPMIQYFWKMHDEWVSKGEKTHPDAFAHLYIMQCYNRMSSIPYSRQEIPHRNMTDTDLRLFIKRVMQPQTETTQTIDRDEYLLNLFNKNEAIYNKFFERCKEKGNVEIVNEILAVIEVLYKERVKEVMKQYTFKSIRTHLKDNGLKVKEYTAFVYAFEYANKRNGEERKTKIENAKKEYQKLLPQKLQDITTITTFVP